jgi:hypothetical protein
MRGALPLLALLASIEYNRTVGQLYRTLTNEDASLLSETCRKYKSKRIYRTAAPVAGHTLLTISATEISHNLVANGNM